MSVERFPDWRKIGKQIGKKLRGILEPSDPGPSRQERLDQRLRDGLRGLVYFDNSEEIGEWEETDVDPVQRANTPLLKRASHHSIPQSRPTSKVLLCHDYSGLDPPFFPLHSVAANLLLRRLPRVGRRPSFASQGKSLCMPLSSIRRDICLLLSQVGLYPACVVDQYYAS